MKDPKLSIQLYSLRRETSADPESVIEEVPGLGFDGVELAGRYGWDADRWKRVLENTGLKVVGAHVGLHLLDGDLDDEVKFAQAIGCPRIIIPALPENLRTVEGYSSVAKKLNKYASRLQDSGIRCLYHNHAFEFARLEDGSNGMDILMADTDPALVAFEIDTYWVAKAGLDPLRYILDRTDRIGMIHAKELRTSDGADTVAGEGDIDFKRIIPHARQHNWAVVVEFEGENALEVTRKSAAYLNKIQVD